MESQLKIYLERYRGFIVKNPLVASEIEIGLKWMSYIAAGRFTQSPVLTELIHSISNLLTLFNDNILRKAASIPVYDDVIVGKLQNYLAIIEYSEVFAEIATHRLIGKHGRWFIILSLQIIKTIIRLLLVLKYNIGIQHSPPIPPLNRKVDVPELCEGNKTEINSIPKNLEVTFTLQHSGRVVRSLESAPPLVSRSWKLPKSTTADIKLCYKNPSKLSDKYLCGEVLHVCRPLAHLISMSGFGEFSWKPWLVAFAIDVSSLHLLQNGKFNRAEKLEISRRALSLIIYLLRSPFYDSYSKIHILNSLKSIAANIPGSGILLRPIIEYIPEWQKLYFYTWAL